MLPGHVLAIAPLVTAFYARASAAQTVSPLWGPGSFSTIGPPRGGELPATEMTSGLDPIVTLSSVPATTTKPPSATPQTIGLPPFACDSISKCTAFVTAIPPASSSVTTVNSLNPIVPPSPCTEATEGMIPILPSDFPLPSLGASEPSASAADDGPSFPPGTTSGSASVPPATMVSAECRTIYVVLEGDLCQLITDEYGVSLTQLLAANPELDSDCGNLKAGERLCIP